jgi:hypothetical protein
MKVALLNVSFKIFAEVVSQIRGFENVTHFLPSVTSQPIELNSTS